MFHFEASVAVQLSTPFEESIYRELTLRFGRRGPLRTGRDGLAGPAEADGELIVVEAFLSETSQVSDSNGEEMYL